MWQVGLNARGVALSLVCLTCVFITLWVGIGATAHKHYETPTPVRNSPLVLFFLLLTADTTRVSIGAGSALISQKNALPANTSGCGSHYLLRQFYTFHCTSGRRVSGRLTKRTSFVCGTLIGGLNTHRGGWHWECFCKPSPLSRVANSVHRYYQLPLGILPRRPSSQHSTVVTVPSPPCIIGGYFFHCLTVLPLRCHQCPPVSDHQTGTPPLPSPQATRRTGNATDFSR